jgi:hypothetical protein
MPQVPFVREIAFHHSTGDSLYGVLNFLLSDDALSVNKESRCTVDKEQAECLAAKGSSLK